MTSLPLYQVVLGEEVWRGLPPALRSMHVSTTDFAQGRAKVERGKGLASRAIGWVFGFPDEQDDVAVEVRFARPFATREIWQRRFGKHRFSSEQWCDNGRLLAERFGPFVFLLELKWQADRLHFIVKGWRAFGVPMPATLAPTGSSFEYVDEEKHFCFHVEIGLPGVGLIVRYQGYLIPANR